MVKKIIFILLIAVGIFLRVHAVDSVPGGLFGDEASLAVNAKTIAQSGTDEYGRVYPFGFESFSDYKMPGYIYASAVVFKILGPSVVSIRFIAIASSVLLIFLIGYLAKLLFPKRKRIGYCASVILALSPFAIHFGRIAYETMLATMLTTGFFIAFLKSMESNKKIAWFVVGALFLFGACWTYPAPRFIIPAFLILFGLSVMLLHPQNTSVKTISFLTGGFLGLSVLSFVPTFLNPLMDKRTLGYVFSSKGNSTSLINTLSARFFHTLASFLRSFNLEFLFDKGDVFAYRSGTKLTGIFLPVFIPAFFAGIFSYIKSFTKNDNSYIFLFVLLVACGLPSALTWDVPYGPRFLPMLIPLTLLIALGLSQLLVFFSNKKIWIQILAAVGFILFSLYEVAFFADAYFIHFAINSQPEFPVATKELGQYLADQRRIHPENTIYFLEGRSCASWSYSDLHFWYFADLPNKPMVAWDNEFRALRQKTGNPFDAYNFLTIPTARFDHVILYPTTQEMANAQKDSLLVHCGISLKDLNPKTEAVQKVFYLYEQVHKDPAYVVSKKL